MRIEVGLGIKVEVYYNLHKNVFSVRHKGKVLYHRRYVALQDVTFAVQKAGNKKARETGQKNVHAFIRGTLTNYSDISHTDLSQQVTYNPYKYESFVNKSDESPRHKSDTVFMCKPPASGPEIYAGA